MLPNSTHTHFFSAPMPYLIGIHSSLAEVRRFPHLIVFFLSFFCRINTHIIVPSVCFGATESQESSSGGRGYTKRRHQHTGVTPRGPEKDPGRRGETRLLLAGL